jgi:hypothetical protein
LLEKEPPAAGGPDDDTTENPIPYAIATWNLLHCIEAKINSTDDNDKITRAIVSLGIRTGIYPALVPSHGIPIIDSGIAQEEFYGEYDKLLTAIQSEESRSRLEGTLKRSLLMSTAFDRALPSLSLHSYDDVLEAKYRLRDELSLCTVGLAKMAEEFSSNPVSNESAFIAEVNASIDAAITELDRRLSATTDRFLRRASLQATIGGLAVCATVERFTHYV